MIRLPLFFATAILLASCAGTQDGSAGWSGGASEKKVGENRYAIRSGTNAISGPPRLKPLLLQKAATVAQREGASGFVVFDPVFGRTYGDAHEAEALVALVGSAPLGKGNFEYFPLPLRTIDASSGTADIQPYATLKETGDYKISLHAFYLDVVDQKNKSMGPVLYVVPAGEQVLGVSAVFKKGGMLSRFNQMSIVLRPNIKSGRVYRLNGSVDGDSLTVWIEDAQSSERLSPLEVSLRDA